MPDQADRGPASRGPAGGPTTGGPGGIAIPRPPAAQRIRAALSFVLVAGLALIAYRQVDFNLEALFTGTADFVGFLGRLAPDWSYLPAIWPPLIETLQIAYIGTFFGTVLAIPLIFLASANTASNGVSMWIARFLLTILRSIPDLLWAAILVPILVVGPLPGAIALTLFSIGILAKLGSETVESIDPGPMEALRAAGAGRIATIVYAVVPQVAATMVSYILYIFEINVRASVIIGYVGAGGIGFLLQVRLNFFDYSAVGLIIVAIFAVVLIIDGVSVWARSRLI
ncbi:MAG TPA: phosphonate ABC transporter, permease protein PhnE [Trueperaceae bacterium]|nr:phosphonate ABC transporter, permease protein PhnE [Trueperaceae bacterium]